MISVPQFLNLQFLSIVFKLYDFPSLMCILRLNFDDLVIADQNQRFRNKGPKLRMRENRRNKNVYDPFIYLLVSYTIYDTNRYT